jgi:hypothetical protein
MTVLQARDARVGLPGLTLVFGGRGEPEPNPKDGYHQSPKQHRGKARPADDD